MIPQFYLGIDLHLKNSYLVLMDRDGEILDEQQLPNGEVKSYLEKEVPTETYAVLEATRNWAFMYDWLCEQVAEVALAHPKELKAISHAAVKTDQIDARTLAHLARLKFLPQAYAASKEVRDLRMQLRYRDTLVRQRTRAKNRIHAVLASYNLISPVTDLFGVSGRDWLTDESEALRQAAQEVIAGDLTLIETYTQHIQEIEARISLTPEQQRDYRLLRSIPGVGDITAKVLLAEIGDVHRFSSPKALCNWAGLTPRIRNSGSVVRHGRISKEGPSLLRAMIGRAATVAARSSKRWYQVHERLLPRCGKKGAKVAVARRLLVVAYHMLVRQQVYQEEYGKP